MPIFVIALLLWPFLVPNLAIFIIGQVILTLIVAGIAYDNDHFSDGFSGKLIFWGIVGMAPFIVTFGILTLNYKEIENPLIEPRQVLQRREEILSLGLESGVNGRFSLGFGSVNNIPFYVAHKATHDGGVRVHYIMGESTLYEDIVPPRQPYYDTIKVQRRERRLNVPDWVLYVTKTKRDGAWRDGEQLRKIHVPPHTVKREFSSQ